MKMVVLKMDMLGAVDTKSVKIECSGNSRNAGNNNNNNNNKSSSISTIIIVIIQ